MFNRQKSKMFASFLGTTAAALSAIMSPRRQELIDDMMRRSNVIADKAKTVSDNVYEGIRTLTVPKSSSNNIFMTGAVLGALIGAGSTFLLTPRTGRQIRNGIAKRYQDMAEMAQDTMDAFNMAEMPLRHANHHRRSSSIRRKVASEAKRTVAHAKKSVSHAKKAVSHAKSAAAKTLKKARSKVASKI